jgi:hypothetical protein
LIRWIDFKTFFRFRIACSKSHCIARATPQIVAGLVIFYLTVKKDNIAKSVMVTRSGFVFRTGFHQPAELLAG